jgi:hypothetical protein
MENRLLQAVYGSLEQSQSADELLYNLDRIERTYNRIINEGIPDSEAHRLINNPEEQTGAVPRPASVEQELWDSLSPEDQELFR